MRATNHAGSSSQTSAQVQVGAPAPTIPKLTHLSVTNRVFAPTGRTKRASGKMPNHKVKLGTTFSFTLDQRASVTVEIQLLHPASSLILRRGSLWLAQGVGGR